MKTGVAVGFVMVALCACAAPQGGSTSDGESSSSSSGAAASTSEDPTHTHATEAIQTVTSETDADPTDATQATADPTGGVCPGLVDAVAGQLVGARCELLLAFDGEGVLGGWHVACGGAPAGEPFDEKSALEATTCCGDGGAFLNPDPIVSPFVVFAPPVDPKDGGVAIISNHLGVVVFDASVGVDAPGTISTPSRWSPADALVAGDCQAVGFSFTDLSSYHAGPGTIPADLEVTLAAAVEASALPAALVQAGAVVDRSVLLGYEDHAGAATSYLVLLELSGA